MIFKKHKLIKSATVYISPGYNRIIIAPKHINQDGIQYEQDACFVYELNVNEEKLGTEIINCLNLYSYKEAQLQFLKRSDWPAFRYSNLKTIKTFQENYIGIDVSGVNDSNLILRIECPIGKTDLLISSYISFNTTKVEIGRRVRDVFEGVHKYDT